MKIYQLIILSIIVLTCSLSSTAQTGYADLMPLINAYPPSIRAASMGFAGVANGGTIQEISLNPASIGTMQEKLQTEFTYSGPVFIEKKSKTFFSGVGFKVNKKLSLAFSRHGYIAKNPNWLPFLGPVYFVPTKVEETYYTITAAYQLIPGLVFGVNANYLNYKLSPVKSTNSYFADAGFLYEKKLKTRENAETIEKKIRFGLSYSNINAAYSKWTFPTGENDILYITSRVIAGGAYAHSLSTRKFIYGDVKLVPKDAHTIDFLAQVQYIKYMPWNSKKIVNPYYWAINAGGEILILKLVAFRFGYRYEKRFGDKDEFSPILNLPYLRGFTYGTGINFPLSHLTNNRCPFDIALDYMYRKPFVWFKPNNSVEFPVTNISIRLNWKLNSN